MTENKIIRCIECEFYKKPCGSNAGWCEKAFMEADISDNDFCSRAEIRKESTSMYVEPKIENKTKDKVDVKPKRKRKRVETLEPLAFSSEYADRYSWRDLVDNIASAHCGWNDIVSSSESASNTFMNFVNSMSAHSAQTENLDWSD